MRRPAIFERLPAFYRENPGLLEPLAAIAEEMLAETKQLLRMKEEAIEREGAGGRIPGWPRGSETRRGTAGEVRRWLEDLCGLAPHVWAGVEARSHAAGGIGIERTRFPSAVLAWEKELLAAPPRGFEIPEELLPATVRVQAVLVGRLSHAGAPFRGEKVAGEIFWSRDQVIQPPQPPLRGGDGLAGSPAGEDAP